MTGMQEVKFQHYLVSQWVSEHVLVEGACEEGIHKLAIIQRLPYDSANELEEVQVVGAPGLVILYNRVGIGLEGCAVLWHLYKETEVGVEDLPCHHLQKRSNSRLSEMQTIAPAQTRTYGLPLQGELIPTRRVRA